MRVIDEKDKCKSCGRQIMKDRFWYKDTDDNKIVCEKCHKKLKQKKSLER